MVAAQTSTLTPCIGIYCQAGSVCRYCAGGPQSLRKSRDIDRQECQQIGVVSSTPWLPCEDSL